MGCQRSSDSMVITCTLRETMMVPSSSIFGNCICKDWNLLVSYNPVSKKFGELWNRPKPLQSLRVLAGLLIRWAINEISLKMSPYFHTGPLGNSSRHMSSGSFWMHRGSTIWQPICKLCTGSRWPMQTTLHCCWTVTLSSRTVPSWKSSLRWLTGDSEH